MPSSRTLGGPKGRFHSMIDGGVYKTTVHRKSSALTAGAVCVVYYALACRTCMGLQDKLGRSTGRGQPAGLAFKLSQTRRYGRWYATHNRKHMKYRDQSRAWGPSGWVGGGVREPDRGRMGAWVGSTAHIIVGGGPGGV